MDASIALILFQDGGVTGAVYALLAIGLVLVFSVTRVIFIPQGEMVTYGALTIAALQVNKFPVVIYLQIVLGLYIFFIEFLSSYKLHRMRLIKNKMPLEPIQTSGQQGASINSQFVNKSLGLGFTQLVIYPF